MNESFSKTKRGRIGAWEDLVRMVAIRSRYRNESVVQVFHIGSSTLVSQRPSKFVLAAMMRLA